MPRFAAAALLLSAAVFVLAGCGSSSYLTVGRPPLIVKTGTTDHVRGSLVCALHAPGATVAKVAGIPMLRAGAIEIKLCRYSGGNDRPPLSLVASAQTSDRAYIRRVTRELNTLPQPKGIYHCPMDDGSEIVLLAGYPHVEPQHVIAGLTGCGGVTNGRADVSGPSPQLGRLMRQLKMLVGP